MADKMSTKALAQIEKIKTFLKQSGENGTSVEEAEASITPPIPLRTLQRRFEQMKERGDVKVVGAKRSTRYYLNQRPADQTDITIETADTIPLSEEGKRLLAVVSRPASGRKPVGYNRDFLESYQPNITSYLSPEDTKKLLRFSQKSTGADQLAGTYARQILERLLIDLSYNSSRLEGNKYSLLDTELLIKQGESATDKSAAEAQMILNHKEAIEFIVNAAGEIDLNRYTILNLHGMLAYNLLPDPAAIGRLRRSEVVIGASVYTPLIIPQLIEEMFEFILEKAIQIKNPFEQSFFVMVHLPYLQPFQDVNKRVSRLAANIPLNHHNLSPISFIDVPEGLYLKGSLAVYELNRVELLKEVFMWAYERSADRYLAFRQSMGEPDPFRSKYRQAIRSLITEIVSGEMDKKVANEFIKNNTENIEAADRVKFIEYTETELLSLHEGNFARYYVTPSEFAKWQKFWV